MQQNIHPIFQEIIKKIKPNAYCYSHEEEKVLLHFDESYSCLSCMEEELVGTMEGAIYDN